MTAIEAVATYLPSRRLSVEEAAGPLALAPMQVRLFRRYHGLDQLHRDPDESLYDMLLGAASRLEALRGHEQRVRYVLYARAFPTVVPYPLNPLHDLCRALGLSHALALTVTQQSCASGLLAIDVAGRLLAADARHARDGDEPLALILAGEKAFTRDSQLLPDTSIFGEGASACLLSHDGPRDRLLAYACGLRGEFDEERTDDAAAFQREYRPALARVIAAALDEAGIAMDDVALVLPHNINLVTWQRLSRQIGCPLDRVLLDNIPVHGHIYCADAFFNYRTALERDRLKPGDRYLVATVGAGQGAAFSAMVFQH